MQNVRAYRSRCLACTPAYSVRGGTCSTTRTFGSSSTLTFASPLPSSAIPASLVAIGVDSALSTLSMVDVCFLCRLFALDDDVDAVVDVSAGSAREGGSRRLEGGIDDTRTGLNNLLTTVDTLIVSSGEHAKAQNSIFWEQNQTTCPSSTVCDESRFISRAPAGKAKGRRRDAAGAVRWASEGRELVCD